LIKITPKDLNYAAEPLLFLPNFEEHKHNFKT